MITEQPVSLLRKLYLPPFYESSMWIINLGGVLCNLPLLPFSQELFYPVSEGFTGLS
jgi:hypothetical protein